MLSNYLNEIQELISSQLLFENKHFYIVYAKADQIPQLLPHIGKMREENFRLSGGGTGNNIDLDRFDQHYIHIIVWDKHHNHLSAAARIGLIDELYEKHGLDAIYTYQEFEFDETFIKEIDRTVEVSRLFVNAKSQRNFYGLYLILFGLSSWIVKSRKYVNVLGSVSISKKIDRRIHEIIAEYCLTRKLHPKLNTLVHPRNPFSYAGDVSHINLLNQTKIQNFSELEKFLDEKLELNISLPVLFKKYDLFKSHYICFGIDDDFSSVTDGLIFMELSKSKQKVIEKIFGKENAHAFFEYTDHS